MENEDEIITEEHIGKGGFGQVFKGATLFVEVFFLFQNMLKVCVTCQKMYFYVFYVINDTDVTILLIL